MKASCQDSSNQHKRTDLESRIEKECFISITQNVIIIFQTTIDAQGLMLLISAENVKNICSGNNCIG